MKVATLFASATAGMRRLGIDSIANVLSIAIERSLTFYAASYAYIAEHEHLTLVTEDNELRAKVRGAIGINE